MKKKLYINRAPRFNTPYGGGNLFFSAMYRNCPPDFELVDTPTRVDAYLIAGLDSDMGRASAAWITANSRGVPIFTRVNDCDARKGTSGVDELWKAAITSSVHTVFVSNWMKDYFISQLPGVTIPCSVIVNGVDREIWRDMSYLGATITDGSPWKHSRILTHHWSDNPMKGADLYLRLAELCEGQDKVFFHYVGRQSYGLEKFSRTVLSPPKSGIELFHELACYRNTVYVNWSQKDPGSNSTIESLALGLPSYATPNGGGSPEFVGADHVLPADVDEAAKYLMHIAGTCTATKNQNGLHVRDMAECAADYYEVIRSMI